MSAAASPGKSFTQEMAWLHTWVGLLIGWLLFPIFLTGSICVFWHEISAWARPESHAIHMPDRSAMLRGSVDYLQAHAPDARLWRIELPFADGRDPIWSLNWTDPDGKPHHLDAVPDGDGRFEHARPLVTQTKGGRMFVDFHWALHPYSYRQPDTLYVGCLLVAAAGIAFLILCVSGVVVHKRIFKDFFVFRPDAKSRQRKWLDAHNVLGVLPFPFHVLIVLTGLAYFSFLYAPSALDRLYHGQRANLTEDLGIDRYLSIKGVVLGPRFASVPIPALVARAEASFGAGSINTIIVRDPGRAGSVVEAVRRYDDMFALSNKQRMAFDGTTGRVLRIITAGLPMRQAWDTISALHFAYFGGALMRWLYLLCGLAGASAIATGLVLFTVKRKEKGGGVDRRFLALAERVTVVSVAGALVACAAYLWAVRLLPAGLGSRGDWEVHLFLLAWAACAAHGLLRAPRRGWREQLGLAALLWLGIPALGFAVPNSALPAMIAAGDWNTAGTDLGALAFGVALAAIAWAVSPRRVVPQARGVRPVLA